MVTFVLINLAPFFAGLVRIKSFLDEKPLFMLFNVVHSCCDVQRNPNIATLHGGNFDPLGVGQELHGNAPHTSAHSPGTAPGHPQRWGAKWRR